MDDVERKLAPLPASREGLIPLYDLHLSIHILASKSFVIVDAGLKRLELNQDLNQAQSASAVLLLVSSRRRTEALQSLGVRGLRCSRLDSSSKKHPTV